ncbi:BNR repeat-containing protein [Agrococcus sediminis]|uniref:BNR repeat-containing protein n=1 Tax=Agrococcus sediminis TaxID=2599924 RepID=UPI0037FD810A
MMHAHQPQPGLRLVTAAMVAALSVAMVVLSPPTPATAESTEAGQSLVAVRGTTVFVQNRIEDTVAQRSFVYGRSGDRLVFGDWNGDGIDTIAVRRGGGVYASDRLGPGTANRVYSFGRTTDELLVGDWNGDGVDTVAVRRGSIMHFTDSPAGGSANRVVGFGRSSDQIVVGDWDGDGIDTIAARRGSSLFVLDRLRSGIADRAFQLASGTTDVLAGDWDGDGDDTLAVRAGARVAFSDSLGGAPMTSTRFGRADDLVAAGRWTSPVERQAPPTARPPADTDFTSQIINASTLGDGYARNSVNTTSFRADSVVTATIGEELVQFAAYYDAQGRVVLASRPLDGPWRTAITQHRGDVTDAHNSISIAVDGEGLLHVAWGMHGTPLRYAVSTAPGSLVLGGAVPMTGMHERSVTYPQFLRASTGDLYFLYRDGSSGNGSLHINRYAAATGEWSRAATRVIDGEGEVSPYWQATIDAQDRIHLSWTFRRTAAVETNSNVYYAVATDASATTWARSDGSGYSGPITLDTAEQIAAVPEGSNLMNQTSMAVDDEDRPFIASYWTSDGVTQYHVIRQSQAGWEVLDTQIRTTTFDLAGIGTKAVPIARPQIAVRGSGDEAQVLLLIRDSERASRAALATTAAIASNSWTVDDLTSDSMGSWEPTYDTSAWRSTGRLFVFLQPVLQGDHETLTTLEPSPVSIVEVLTP